VIDVREIDRHIDGDWLCVQVSQRCAGIDRCAGLPVAVG
jgi:hypothetical protein